MGPRRQSTNTPPPRGKSPPRGAPREAAGDRARMDGAVAVTGADEPPLGFTARSGGRARLLDSIVRSSDDAIITLTLDGTILDWNPAAERLFGYRAAEAVGGPVTVVVPPELLAEERRLLRRLRRGGTVDHFETVRTAKDGRRLTVSISVSPIRGAGGRVAAACMIMRDVTERKRAEAESREREQRLDAIVNTAADAIITIDERGVMQSVNPAAERLFGHPAAAMVGRNVAMLMPEPYRAAHDGYLDHYRRTGHARVIGRGREVRGLRRDGTTFPIYLSVGEVRLAGRRLFTGIIHDLTERRVLERQILEAAGNEQRRIGRDLHDGLCQDLIGVAFGIDAVANALPACAAGATGSLAKLAESVRAAATQARDLAHGLNPVDLKAGGLPVALKGLATKVSRTFGIRCEFRTDGRPVVREDTVATHLYRIAQEAVSNAIRHGNADRIDIDFSAHRGLTRLSVSDNGSGIPHRFTDATVPARGPASAGIGLQTMRYRAHVIGGTLSVAAGRHGGSVVSCALPGAPGATAAESGG